MSCGRAARGAYCQTTCRHWGTIYRWFAAWRDDGRFERINHALVMADRKRGGRDANPSAAIIDGQSVKATEAGGPRGYDRDGIYGATFLRRIRAIGVREPMLQAHPGRMGTRRVACFPARARLL
jgi:hypothetical protein